jgi:hypothetical protein
MSFCINTLSAPHKRGRCMRSTVCGFGAAGLACVTTQELRSSAHGFRMMSEQM